MVLLKHYSWKKFTAIYEDTAQNNELYHAIEHAIKQENLNISRGNEELENLLIKPKNALGEDIKPEDEFYIQNVTVLKSFAELTFNLIAENIVKETMAITRSESLNFNLNVAM
jgi:hypothetical protein